MSPRIIAVYVEAKAPLRPPPITMMSIPSIGGGDFRKSCLAPPRAMPAPKRGDKKRKRVRFVDEVNGGFLISNIYEVESYKSYYNPVAEKNEVNDVNCKSCRCNIF
jgi:hypothetical protein